MSNLTGRLRSDQVWANALQAAGLDAEDLDRDHLKLMIDNRRKGTKEAERYFTRLFEEGVEPLRAPMLPIGFGLVASYGSAAFEPLLLPGGPLADTVGLVIGPVRAGASA